MYEPQNMGQWHDAILEAVEQSTYDMLVSDYRAEEMLEFGFEPAEFIAEHKLEGRAFINPADFPPGTWFCYPKRTGTSRLVSSHRASASRA